MQPTYDESSNSDTGSWGTPPGGVPGYAPAPPGDSVTKARPWLTALWSFVTLLVVIAAGSNQWVVDAVVRHSNGQTLGDQMAHLVGVYRWRFSPQGGHDFARIWVAGLAGVGTTLVLTLLLVAVVARGFGRFWQTLFSVWFAVLAATLVGGYVRTGLTDVNQLAPAQHESVAYNTLFSTLSPNTSTIIAGFIVGLIVGLLAAVVAVATRRSDVVAAPPPASFGVPWSRSDDDDERAWQSAQVPRPTASPSPWSTSDTEHTGTAGPEQTAQLPAVEQPRSDDDATVQHAPPSAADDDEGGDDATTQFPRHSSPPPEERP